MKIAAIFLTIASVASVSAYGIIKVRQSHERAYNAWITHVESYAGDKIDTIRPVPADVDSYRYVSRSIEWKTFKAFADSFNIPATPSRFAMLSDNEVFRIREQFWYQSGANQLQDVAIAAFFAEMYYAAPASIRYFQSQLKREKFPSLKVSGKLDAQTVRALEQVNKRELWNWLFQKRNAYIYNKTTLASMRKYRKGLLKRSKDFHQKFESFLTLDQSTREIEQNSDTTRYKETVEVLSDSLEDDLNKDDSVRIVVLTTPTNRSDSTKTRLESSLTEDEVETISDTKENGVRIIVNTESDSTRR